MSHPNTRRSFLRTVGLGAAGLGFAASGPGRDDPRRWTPVSDRKLRVGLVGYGVCRFAAEFSFQHHPNVEVAAVSDLFPDRCAELAKVVRCATSYPSLEEMVKDDTLEAIFVATDAPSHARHCIEVLKHGKHVASAVPAVYGSLEEADALLAAVKSSGLKYMMFETSFFRGDLFAMRTLFRTGALGAIVYSEGEYFHYMEQPIPSYRDWRVGLPPQWYPTHSNAYQIGVTGGSFTEVSCMGVPSRLHHLQQANNRYHNPYGTEIALFRTTGGGTSRMGVSWDTPGHEGEVGRVRGQKGSFDGKYQGLEKNLPSTERPLLPPGVEPGGHGGSHGYLMHEFVTAILEDRTPIVDVATALNLTSAGIVAHQSALKHGELLKIPQYRI